MATIVKIAWNAKKYVQNVNRQTAASIRRASQLVIKTTRTALDKPGENAVSPLNTVKKKDRFESGASRIQGLQSHGVRHFGGSIDIDNKTVKGVYWNAAAHKWTTASAPGTPPHKQTGLLRRRIDAEYSRNGLTAKVGPRDGLVYGRVQELGGPTWRATLPPRPYLGPSFDAVKDMCNRIIKYGIKKAGTK
jgi:phage gpG-like protein